MHPQQCYCPKFQHELVSLMQQSRYSLCIDGSNDTGSLKMNPLTVRIFDLTRTKVDTRFLDMCTTSGINSATAESIFSKMSEVLVRHSIPWINCVGVGVDNTSVNMGKSNSIMTRVYRVNPGTYFMGCPYHIAHNTANTGREALRRKLVLT